MSEGRVVGFVVAEIVVIGGFPIRGQTRAAMSIARVCLARSTRPSRSRPDFGARRLIRCRRLLGPNNASAYPNTPLCAPCLQPLPTRLKRAHRVRPSGFFRDESK